MVFDFGNFDVQDTTDKIGGVLSSAMQTLDRPRGAINAAIQLKNPLEGWNNPDQFQGQNDFGIQHIQNDAVRNVLGEAVNIATDPVNYGLALIPYGGEAAIGAREGAELAGRAALSDTGRGLISNALKDVGKQFAYAGVGRATNSAVDAALSNTDLPQPVKSGIGLAAGIGSGILTGKALNGPLIGSAARMTEEEATQADSQLPHYADYINNVTANDGVHVLDKQGNTLYVAPDAVTARQWANDNVPGSYEQYKVVDAQGNTITGPVSPYVVGGLDQLEQTAKDNNGTLVKVITPSMGTDYSIKKVDSLKDLIASHTLTDYDVPVGHSESEPLIQRNVNILPADKAPKDIILDNSHQQYTTSFKNFINTNPQADAALKNWIGSSSGQAGSLVRDAFSSDDINSNDFRKVAVPIDSLGEEWRQWAHSQDTPFIQNGMVYLYRGESASFDTYKVGNGWDSTGEYGYRSSPVNEKDFPVASWTTDPEAASNFAATKDLENPYTGNTDRTNFILGKWVPIDDVIAPVGGASQEHEFLVMDRAQIPDKTYEALRGVSKDVPYGTTKYAIINPSTGETLRYVDSEAEAIKATDSPQNGNKQEFNIYRKDSDGVVEAHPATTFDSMFAAKYFTRNSDNFEIREENNPTTTYLDYQPVTRGFEPQVNIANTNQLHKDGGGSNIFAGMFGSTAPVPSKMVEGDINSAANTSKQFDQLTPVTPPEQLPENVIANNIIGNEPTPVEPIIPTGNDAAGGQPPIKPPTDSTPPVSPEPADSNNLNNAQKSAASDVGVDPTIGPNIENLPEGANQVAIDNLVGQLGASTNEQFINLITQGMQKAGKTDASFLGKANSIMRTLWATGDGSWLGIQGLLTVPRLLLKGDLTDAKDIVNVSLMALAGDSTAMGNFIKRTIETMPEGAPSLLEAQKAGLHLAFLHGSASDVNFNFGGLLSKVPVIGGALDNSENAFTYAGDVARITSFYNEWQRFPTADLSQLASAINRATGIAAHPFGGHIGTFALFAPKFFQSQLETVVKAVTDGTIEGQLARRQMLSLIGTGALLTAAANYVRGEDTEYNPTSGDFMRIKNVAGANISVFGPWDSLAKLIVHMGTGAADIAQGNQTQGASELSYVRSKFSPVLDLATNIVTGKTFLGDNFYDPATLAKSMLLPFAWQNVGREPAISTAIGFFGVKSSALTPSEIVDQNMENLGQDPTDPLARRQYLADNPQQKNYFSDAQKQGALVTKDIAARANLNDTNTASNLQTLIKFKDNRTILAREQRNKLDVLLGNGNQKAPVTQQDKWIASYYAMFDGARDPITHDINGPQLDQLQSEWTAQNGQEAFDYMQRYQLVGKNPVEEKYLQDMNSLRDIGYFDMHKYQPIVYNSGLTDNQIQSYRDTVSAARSVDPKGLGAMSFAGASRQVLSKLTPQQITSIDLAGSKSFENPAVSRLKQQYPALFVWFNPNAKWQDLQTAQKRDKLPIPAMGQLASVGSR